MTTPFEIPLTPTPQRLVITLAGVDYVFFVKWCDPAQCWVVDLCAADETVIIGGIALVTGTDLLHQYGYLNIGGALYVQSDVDLGAVPTYDSLGVAGHLYFVTP